GSALHRLTALPDADVRAMMQRDCRCTGDFLRLLMEALVRRQGASRWAETTPAHLQYMREIKAQIPDALFVHVVRDGRDVAASLSQLGWLYAYPFDRNRPALPAAAYWDWLVRRGRAEGESLGGDYLEVHYEALVQEPRATLARLAEFIEQPLDYDTIQRTGVGSVARPNTSFPGATGGFHGRWRTELSPEDGAAVDALLGETLTLFGYEPAGNGATAAVAARRALYAARFTVRDWTKRWTPLARYATDLSLYAPHATPVTEEKLAGV
ncbi:MAG TPA: sulfotransferase, partial [Gemmatimonadales bacterium]|nr:sulfotransferase [Gemmatimonadales bacterium]